MLKACIYTLGCRVNQYESDAIMRELSKSGVEIVGHEDPCDICIINTCSVTHESDRKSKQIIRRLISKNPHAVTVVTGCYSQINPQNAMKIPGVSLVCGNNDKSKIAKMALELARNRKEECTLCMSDIYSSKFDTMRVGAPLVRVRAFIKIQDGCNSKCAYCIIPYARGCVRSASKEDVMTDVNTVVNEGCREIVLTGIETAAYGKDLKNGHSLGDLILEVNEIEDLKRIRLGSLDPASITKEFVDKIKNADKLMPHFHISMQSGCTKTLNEMKRKYNIDMAKKNIGYLRKCIPNIMLSADVITGFPNETEEDFSKTLEFFENEKFLHLHIFPYSKRNGTPAAEMKNQVPEEIKKARLHKLSHQQKVIKKALLEDYIKQNPKIEVLFESFDGTYISGHTPSFVEVKVESDRPRKCEFLFVEPTHTDGEFVYGKLI
ncbi:MAG: tRNA (N(6)-L-threonylcarbamoyladenosine(37)-C(2))-methylthiotransferase MtaB [Clostridia bacterium]|nr:tRNA (N(6)-L-threonylcarbamoyladenosine(37)-C(2))-methylthiotransferase MtaB [Clostridia bacterium]